MRNQRYLVILALVLGSLQGWGATPYESVDVMIGTIPGMQGATVPAATVPFGMIKAGPDNVMGMATAENPARVQFDLAHKIGGVAAKGRAEVVDGQTIRGWTACDSAHGLWGKEGKYTVYFYAKFDRLWTSHGFYKAAHPSYDLKKIAKVWSDPALISALSDAAVEKGGKECEADLMGLDNFRKKLDALFDSMPDGKPWGGYEAAFYNHGNEPVHFLPYAFNYDGCQWQTQKWARHIMKEAYTTRPTGICGNDDVGQMSAWFVMSTMGIHLACPGDNVWQSGSPMHTKDALALTNGKTFAITAENNSEKAVYIQSATLNGKPHDRAWLTHEEIMVGGELKLVMGIEPSKWGATQQAPSFSNPVNR